MIKVKICGMKHPDNLQEIARLEPDYLGFIFYSGSKRFIGGSLTAQDITNTTGMSTPVAVVVNHSMAGIEKIASEFPITHFQLHGEESPEWVKELKVKHPEFTLVKAIPVSDKLDLDLLTAFEPWVDFFLFDTKGHERGGNGLAFDWEVLSNYQLTVPYWLSGGIGLENIESFVKLLPRIQAPFLLDLNSRLEIEPGLKDLEKARKAVEYVRSINEKKPH